MDPQTFQQHSTFHCGCHSLTALIVLCSVILVQPVKCVSYWICQFSAKGFLFNSSTASCTAGLGLGILWPYFLSHVASNTATKPPTRPPVVVAVKLFHSCPTSHDAGQAAVPTFRWTDLVVLTVEGTVIGSPPASLPDGLLHRVPTRRDRYQWIVTEPAPLPTCADGSNHGVRRAYGTRFSYFGLRGAATTKEGKSRSVDVQHWLSTSVQSDIRASTIYTCGRVLSGCFGGFPRT